MVAPLELGVSSIFFIATIAGPPVEYITSSTIVKSEVQNRGTILLKTEARKRSNQLVGVRVSKNKNKFVDGLRLINFFIIVLQLHTPKGKLKVSKANVVKVLQSPNYVPLVKCDRRGTGVRCCTSPQLLRFAHKYV